jgi:hypothetical protein
MGSGSGNVTFMIDGEIVGEPGGSTVKVSAGDEHYGSYFSMPKEGHSGTISVKEIKSRYKQMSPRLRSMFKVIRMEGHIYL